MRMSRNELGSMHGPTTQVGRQVCTQAAFWAMIGTVCKVIEHNPFRRRSCASWYLPIHRYTKPNRLFHYNLRLENFDQLIGDRERRASMNPPLLPTAIFCVRICVRHPLLCVIGIRTSEHGRKKEKSIGHVQVGTRMYLYLCNLCKDTRQARVESWCRLSFQFHFRGRKIEANARVKSVGHFVGTCLNSRTEAGFPNL